VNNSHLFYDVNKNDHGFYLGRIFGTNRQFPNTCAKRVCI